MLAAFHTYTYFTILYEFDDVGSNKLIIFVIDLLAHVQQQV